MASVSQAVQKFVIDLDIEGLSDLDGLTKALQGTTQAAKFTDISFKETVKSILNFTQASGRTINSVQGQIRAFSQLRNQTAIQSKFYNELTGRINRLNNEYATLVKSETQLGAIRTSNTRKDRRRRENMTGADLVSRALQPFGKRVRDEVKGSAVSQTISQINERLSQLSVTQDGYTEALTIATVKQNQYNAALARQESIARNLIEMDRAKHGRFMGGGWLSRITGEDYPKTGMGVEGRGGIRTRKFQRQGLWQMDPKLAQEPTWPLNLLGLGGKLGRSLQENNWFYKAPFLARNWAGRFLGSHTESRSWRAARDEPQMVPKISGSLGVDTYKSKYGTPGYLGGLQFPKSPAGFSAAISETSDVLNNLDYGSKEYGETLKRLGNLRQEEAKLIKASRTELEKKGDVQDRDQRRAEKLMARYGKPGAPGTIDPTTGARIGAGTAGRGGAIVPYQTIYGPHQRVSPLGAPTFATHGPMREISGFYQGITDLGMSKINKDIDLMGNSWEKAARDISKAAKAGDKSVNSLEKQRTLLGQLRNQMDPTSAGFRKITSRIQQLDKALGKANATGGRFRTNFAAIGGVLSAGLFGGPAGLIGGGVGALAGRARGLRGPELGGAAVTGGLIASQAAGAFQGIAQTATYASDIEKARIALRGITKDQDSYAFALEAAERATREFNIPQEDAIKGVTRLSAAVLGSGGNIHNATEAYINTIAAIKGTAGSADDARSAITAMVQIFSKGKVSAEELSGQLGERFPAAVTKFAKANNISTQELQASLKQGEVGLDMLSRFVESLGAEFIPLAREIAKSAEEAGARATVAWNDFRIAVGKSLKSVGAELQVITADLLTELLPLVKTIAQAGTLAIKSLLVVIKPLTSNLGGVLATMQALAGGTGVYALAKGFQLLSNITKMQLLRSIVTLKKQMRLLRLEMMLNPWFAAGVGITAIGMKLFQDKKALGNFIEEVKDGTRPLKEVRKELKNIDEILERWEGSGSNVDRAVKALEGTFGPIGSKDRLEEIRNQIAVSIGNRAKDEYDPLTPGEGGGDEDKKNPLVALKEEFSNTTLLIQNVWAQAFGHMENTLMNFLETGKMNFKAFARSIISDIMRMFVKAAILLPLMQALGLGGGGGGPFGIFSGGGKKKATSGTSGIGPFASGAQYGAALQGANTASYGPGSSQGFGLGTYGAGIPSGAAGWGFSKSSLSGAHRPLGSRLAESFDSPEPIFLPSAWSQGSGWESIADMDYASFGNNNPFTGNPHSIYEGIGTHGDFLPSNPAWHYQWGVNGSEQFPGGRRQLLDFWRRGYFSGPQIAAEPLPHPGHDTPQRPNPNTPPSSPWLPGKSPAPSRPNIFASIGNTLFGGPAMAHGTHPGSEGSLRELFQAASMGDRDAQMILYRHGYTDFYGPGLGAIYPGEMTPGLESSLGDFRSGQWGHFSWPEKDPGFTGAGEGYGEWLRKGDGLSGSSDDVKKWLMNFGINLWGPKEFASGGIIDRPTLSLMGENGPEAVVPLRRGSDGKLGLAGGSGSTVINVDVDAKGTKVQGEGNDAARLGKLIGAAIQAELTRQKRPGGMLSGA